MYLSFEQNYIVSKVPKGFSFLGVMDLFFKVHKVFNVEYHNSIKSMMLFIGHTIYKTNDSLKSLPPAVLENAIKLTTEEPYQPQL